MVKLAPLRWYGGKQAGGKSKWVAGFLPWERDSSYCEPFGGMMSVLLARDPVKCEIFNDLSLDVVNWWRVVRDDRDKFGEMVESTPHSREEFDRACVILNNGVEMGIERAWAFHVVVSQDIAASPARQYWGSAKKYNSGSLGRWRSERVAALAERVWNVQLENRDALELMDWLSGEERCVMYCDPPYYSSHTKLYEHGYVDSGALREALLAQSGRVAVSGYGDEWDDLGWERHERDSYFSGLGKEMRGSGYVRKEVLWCNFGLGGGVSLFDEEVV